MSATELKEANLEKISKAAGNAFRGQSNSYKQKLVYSLLNAIKTENKDEFMSILLRSLNARKGNVSGLMNEVQKIQNNLRTKEFVDIAYAIVIGIMSTYKEENVGEYEMEEEQEKEEE